MGSDARNQGTKRAVSVQMTAFSIRQKGGGVVSKTRVEGKVLAHARNPSKNPSFCAALDD